MCLCTRKLKNNGSMHLSQSMSVNVTYYFVYWYGTDMSPEVIVYILCGNMDIVFIRDSLLQYCFYYDVTMCVKLSDILFG